MFLTSQKNSLYKAVEERGFNLHDFRLEESTELRLTQTRTGYYFRVYTGPVQTSNGEEQRLYALYTPAFRNPVVTGAEVKITGMRTWPELMGYVGLWLNWLKAETTQPDLWVEMEQASDFFTEQEPLPEDAFTPAEIKLLEARAEHIEQQLSELDLPAETEQAIAQAVREVPEKSKRLTKKEMGEILLSSVLREGFKAALSKDTMLAVWHLLMNFFTLAIGQ